MINEVREHPNNIISKDHLGNIFPTIKAMCEYWGLTYKIVLYRLNHGMTIKEALTTKENKRQIIIDKKSYRSATEACLKLGLNLCTYNTYRSRFKMGREEAIFKLLLNKERMEKKEAQK